MGNPVEYSGGNWQYADGKIGVIEQARAMFERIQQGEFTALTVDSGLFGTGYMANRKLVVDEAAIEREQGGMDPHAKLLLSIYRADAKAHPNDVRFSSEGVNDRPLNTLDPAARALDRTLRHSATKEGDPEALANGELTSKAFGEPIDFARLQAHPAVIWENIRLVSHADIYAESISRITTNVNDGAYTTALMDRKEALSTAALDALPAAQAQHLSEDDKRMLAQELAERMPGAKALDRTREEGNSQAKLPLTISPLPQTPAVPRPETMRGGRNN